MTVALEPISLRDYQSEAMERVRSSFRCGKRRVCLVMPTGAGKTRVAAAMAQVATAAGKRVLFVAHLRELITQGQRRFAELGLEAGLVLAGHAPAPELPIQVGSIQTLTRRTIPSADLVILDECHRAAAASYQKLFQALPEAWTVGLTATPVRADGKGLGDTFEDAVIGTTAAELIERGVLVAPRVLAPETGINLSKVRVQRGDYATKDLEKVMGRKEIVGDVVGTWIRHAQGRRTVAFAVSVAHAQMLADGFNAAGIRSAMVCGETPPDERRDLFEALSEGRLKVLANCGVLCEGWDMPEVEVGILARPTKSKGLYIQQVGRVIRAAPGKTEALVLDHAGNVHVHGLPDEYAPQGLDPGRERGARPTKECPECSARVPITAEVCPHCNYLWVDEVGDRPPQEIVVVDGELREVKRASMDDKVKAYEDACLTAFARGYKPGWAAHFYKRKFGVWPSGDRLRACRERYFPKESPEESH